MSLQHLPFDGTEKTIESRLVSDQELREVLQAMEEEQFHGPAHEASPYDDWATIDSICEVTGHTETEISRILYQIRREDVASRLASRMRELEEPLYRVERPGHYKPSTLDSGIRSQQIETILDRIVPKPSAHLRSKVKETFADKAAPHIGMIIVLLVLLGSLALIIQSLMAR